jgi:hypothetical protein
MKVEKKPESLDIPGYLLELIIKTSYNLDFSFSFKIWQIWDICFFHEKFPLHRLKSYFFRLKFGEILPKKEDSLGLHHALMLITIFLI